MFNLADKNQLRDSGDSLAKEYLKAEGLYRPGSAATAYTTNLCNQMYAVTEASQEAVQCNLSDDGTFGAFATPGYLFVQRGLLPYLNSEDELAAVLGHEAGHLTARHTARKVTNAELTAALLGGVIDGLAGAGMKDSPLQTTTDASVELGKMGLAKFSRSYETEADALGRRYLEKAGYNPAAGVNMARSLLNYDAYMSLQQQAFGAENESILDRLKSSHPSSPERVAAALAATGEPSTLPPGQDAARQRYMAAIHGLAWGPQRRYGIARKNELVLTRQRVVIPFPQGTTTSYLPSGHPKNLGTWLFAHPASGVYVRLTSIPMQSGSNPGVLVEKMLPTLHSKVERITIGSGQALAAAGATLDDLALTDPDDTTETADAVTDAALAETETYVPADVIGYTATYRYLNTPKRFRVVAFGAATRANEMLLYTVIYPNQQVMDREDANLMAILKNVRFITRDQALKYQPLEVFTFTAAAGDSVARQASKLPVSALSEPLFRALNNLPAGTEMEVGQLYKTIIDPNP